MDSLNITYLHEVKGKANIVRELSKVWTFDVLGSEVCKDSVFSIHVLAYLYSLLGCTGNKQ